MVDCFTFSRKILTNYFLYTHLRRDYAESAGGCVCGRAVFRAESRGEDFGRCANETRKVCGKVSVWMESVFNLLKCVGSAWKVCESCVHACMGRPIAYLRGTFANF